MSSMGSRIFGEVDRVAASAAEEFLRAGVPTANIADAMGRFGAVGRGIRALGSDDVYLAGCAFTVRVAPADNLLLHKALDLAKPGDAILVDAGGDTSHAIAGELMFAYAKERGIRGFVVDGSVRDGASIRRMGYPVFAKGLTPLGPYKEGPGEINVPIGCGGAAVHPGDLVVGDADGVVVVPRDHAEEVLERALVIQRNEQDVMRSISEGRWERRWVDQALREKGFETIE